MRHSPLAAGLRQSVRTFMGAVKPHVRMERATVGCAKGADPAQRTRRMGYPRETIVPPTCDICPFRDRRFGCYDRRAKSAGVGTEPRCPTRARWGAAVRRCGAPGNANG